MIDTNVLESDLTKCNQRLKTYPFDPRMYIYRGMIYFKLIRLEESLRDFNKAEELNPQLTPYLWQRGITYYYLQKYAKAARQFEVDLSINSLDIEETIWYYLSIAQLEDAQSARNSLLPVKPDARSFMTSIYRLFAGKATIQTIINNANTKDIREMFYLNLYIGLYYEAQREKSKSWFYMDKAISYKIDDYMWYLACVHQQIRV
ncbi:tetratricopeptide repeat protein [Geminocystis sp. CENA526]|uniref:tetratricopeptide repeat protein n=1 Tax=Geminocystis sp. CENA526 TaxID=1355871 RepID=UPI003D6EC2B6